MENKYFRGIQFLDEKDNEIVKLESNDYGDWGPAKELPAGFEIIGVYGNTTKNGSNPQFGFLLWNPKPVWLNEHHTFI